MKASDLAWALLWPPAYAFGGIALHRITAGTWLRIWFPQTLSLGFAAAGGGTLGAYLIGRDWPAAAIGAAWAAAGFAIWQYRRRRRRRALALLGHKARAIIAAMTRRMRERRRPSRVLRPSPVPS